MLKRIKVRGKLLLLLATPLVAVMVFAASGILDRLDSTEFQEREARIAELANAGSDLSLAIQIERIRVLEVERLSMGGDELIDPERTVTNAEFDHWLAAVDSARGDITDPALLADFDDLAERLPTTLAPDRGSDMVTSTLLASASRAIDETTIALRGQAADLDLFRALTNLNELTNIQSAYATITSVGSDAIFQGDLDAVGATLIREAERQAETNTQLFKDTAERGYVEQLERLENADVIPSPTRGTGDAIGLVQSYLDDTSLGGGVAWLERGEEQLTSINALIDTLATDVTDSAQFAAGTARDESRSFLVLAGSVILLAILMAVIIGRSISRPLTRLTRSAEQLSTEELPALVESMRSAGRAEAPVLTPIEAKGRDEVAQLAHAISEIQQVTIDVAEEQGELLRRGISDIFVNLARRNQSLLDRQIDFIDQLESREENPDQLENLFRLDHLATRMRRNAESLLVLAGAEPTRRRGRPVEIVDVLRVAMGEIEDFNRIDLGRVDPATVAGSVAVDLAHLMSELMENATQFSPPQVDVSVSGDRHGDGSFVLRLEDRGIGMSAEQIATANRTLAEPPLVGLDLSRSLGFTVVSRLAHRLGVKVELASGSDGGVTAMIVIPAEMVGELRDGADDLDPADAPALELGPADGPAPDTAMFAPTTPDAADEPVVVEDDETTAEPGTVDEPAPAGTLFADFSPPDDGARATDDAVPTPPVAVPPPVPDLADLELSRSPFAPDESAPLDPPALPQRRATTDTTAAAEPGPAGPPALPQRRPVETSEVADRAAGSPAAGTDMFSVFGGDEASPAPPPEPGNDIFTALDRPQDGPAAEPAPPAPDPQPPHRDPAEVGVVSDQVTSAGLIRRQPRRVDVPEESKYAPGVPVAPAAEPTPTATPNRSPDEVRQMLSRYRAGLRKGRGPATDDRSDRPS